MKRDGGRGYTAEFLSKTPLSATVQRDLLALYNGPLPDYLSALSSAEKKARLAKMSHTDFMLNVVKVDPQVMWFFQGAGNGSFAVGADALPALFAWQTGLSGMHLEPTPDGVLADLPGGHHGRQRPGGGSVHFPDSNATLTRLLVRSLIPTAVPGTTQEDVGTARVDYGVLDRADQTVQVRLNSTVVNVRHRGAGSARDIEVSYVRRGQTHQVLGGGGFDPGRDIVAISVNRWPHGYAYTYNSLYDPMEWVFTSTNERPCVVGRQPFGQITIANSDAAASPHTDAAILEAHRAVQEVLQRRAMPVLGG